MLFHGLDSWPLRALTVSEIKEIVVQYADAAERAKKAGFDGVELHGDHYYLINSFLSRMWNRRDDEYGAGSLENRCRFALEVITACRERVGEDYLLGIKLNGAEYGVPEGTTSEECQQFARWLEAAGCDYFNVAADGYADYGRIAIAEQLFYPEPPRHMIKELASIDFKQGMNVHVAAAVKKAVSVPVIAVGKLDAPLGEKFISEGKVDAVAIGRRLIADPEYPNKALEGREDDVRPCTSCITCESLAVLSLTDGVRCQVNASLGRGADGERFIPAESPKRVAVVGGGPAGMEAARVMALRGHDVTLYEREAYLGGLVNMAALVKGTEIFDLPGLVEYQKGQICTAWREGEAWRGVLRRHDDAHQAARGGDCGRWASSYPRHPGHRRQERHQQRGSAEARKAGSAADGRQGCGAPDQALDAGGEERRDHRWRDPGV